jgi:hypothetical protein
MTLSFFTDGGSVGLHTTNKTEAYFSTKRLAGDSHGDVSVAGRHLNKPGGGFKIDHPLDPANKYLYHSFVEFSDMKNIYDGVVVLNENSRAEVKLPNRFETLNEDFRYQLTTLGCSAPNLHIEEEITNSHFKIAGGTHGMKVCWQVTRIRKDPWAGTNRVKIEEKPANERDCYLQPELYDKHMERSMAYACYPESQKFRQTMKKIIEKESNRFK